MTPARRFAFRLALALGESNPDALLAQLPYRVFRDWTYYFQLEPFGEERADFRAGIISAVVANCLARKRGRPAFHPSDFMPNFEKQERTADELVGQMIMINRVLGGSVVDKRGKPN